MEFCQVQNSLCVQVLCSPILTALLHGTRAVGISQTLQRGTRNGITELLLLVICNRGQHLYSKESRWASAHIAVYLLHTVNNRHQMFLTILTRNTNKSTFPQYALEAGRKPHVAWSKVTKQENSSRLHGTIVVLR